VRRFIAAFVATVAGLVLLLSFKIAPSKSSAQPLASAGVPGSSTPDSAGPAASPPASSAASSAAPAPSSSAVASPATTTPSTTPKATTPKATPKATPTATPKATSKATTKTVTGSTVTVGERGRVFGTVQVRLTLTGGKITAITELQYPQDDPRSSEISQFAIPTLRAETLSAQSARIDTVSGATYTSAGYAQSVQAALDSAKS
jgi:uncharacterized protein with FMN-binding domain